MRIHSVNVGLPEEITHGQRTIVSGIYKTPVGGRVMARHLNLEGDGQADLAAHGGEQRAVYAYPWVHFHHWAHHLGRDGLPPGVFGENLTLDNVTEEDVCIGDRFRVGGESTAILEVTQPRPPCYKLEMRLGAPGFAKTFLRSGRVGFYLRVIEEGDVGAGDKMERIAAGPEQMNVTLISNLMYFDKDNLADAERALRIPALSPGWQDTFRRRVEASKGEGKESGP